MTSTIQLSNQVKETLATYRTSSRESYEKIIINLISEFEQKKRADNELLIEGCKDMAKESLKICHEWEHIDKEVNAKW